MATRPLQTRTWGQTYPLHPIITGQNDDGSYFTPPEPFTEWTVRNAPAVNTQAVATRAAPGAGLSLFITGFYLTATGTVAAAVTATLADGATTIFDQFVSTSAQTISVVFIHPMKITTNTAATLTLPALGASGTGIAALRGYTA